MLSGLCDTKSSLPIKRKCILHIAVSIRISHISLDYLQTFPFILQFMDHQTRWVIFKLGIYFHAQGRRLHHLFHEVFQ